jgi:hypothetical protein
VQVIVEVGYGAGRGVVDLVGTEKEVGGGYGAKDWGSATGRAGWALNALVALGTGGALNALVALGTGGALNALVALGTGGALNALVALWTGGALRAFRAGYWEDGLKVFDFLLCGGEVRSNAEGSCVAGGGLGGVDVAGHGYSFLSG